MGSPVLVRCGTDLWYTKKMCTRYTEVLYTAVYLYNLVPVEKLKYPRVLVHKVYRGELECACPLALARDKE